ncbi:hypothetical protein TTHERM_000079599 (macronuclear) [Tetrahymena thermophila SB210]|uniref:Kinase domain protein n=1 Tax=Tetrahymena thermophila (strain SB210) TaxID=312017 RepID=W7XCZ0_TETTS|nr:hypothetical protein TTHERM_000079599 [Tetrahymena thermophila SB210]EWS74463.1 hypothetical protein TTHERM_000079599 [Tetrahymena thermophila SB210]|eukprot:XP_012653040.1 hypothetical protein TTHERM_000079599 [Tetrahymena thermophila SB210]
MKKLTILFAKRLDYESSSILFSDFCKDCNTSKIAQSLSSLTNLSTFELQLVLNSFDQQKTLGICSVLENCKNLSTLKLQLNDNEITDDILSQMCQSLSSCKHILHLELYLDCNSISEQSVTELGSALSKCFNLISLEFWLNDVTIFAFARYLPNMINLRNLKLHLGHDSVSEDQQKQLSIFVLKLKKLVQKQITIY